MMSPIRVHKLIEILAEGDDDLFAQGLLNELNIRKQELCKEVSIKIFENMGSVPVSKTIDMNEDIKKFIVILEKFQNNSNVKINFKNESILNISDKDIEPIKYLFDNLNEENQKVLAKDLFETPQHFKHTLEFAKKVKGLFS
jgi:hypothetical protein